MAEANALALALIDRPGDWPQGRLVLTGPEGAGKSHLVRVWAASGGATILPATDLPDADIPRLAAGDTAVEDLDRSAGQRAVEEAMFHLLNLAAAEGGRVLVTARTPPRDWGLTLPDLLSRISAAQVARIEAPDDTLLSAVLMKHFADRQLAPTPDAMAWLLTRLARRFDAVAEAAERLDRMALASGRSINRALVRDLAATAPHLFE
ncbi:DnaA ATPase domain-containing protein [Pseudaestuariivita atlantica]|uniref:DnaA ATPase domain-containing protein n=1 Tax=Pseudaestuariivita atlantica TaxID=1317121 RepID=UPI001F5FB129|nr:DnaA/Hda family protein [Pseudaestuariivita atlantica]